MVLGAAASLAFIGCSGGASAQNTLVPTTAEPSSMPGATAAPAASQNATSSPLTAPSIGTVNGAQSAPPPSTESTSVPVTIHYVLPAGVQSAATTQSSERRLQYISTSNVNITITVTPVGGGATVYGPTGCTSGSCTISFTANPGADVIAFSLTDGSANVLSRFTTTQIVQPNIENTFHLTANPVVNSVTLTLAAAPIPYGGTAVDIPLTVNALDKDGNTIVGAANYVDASGNPLALTLSTANYQAGGKGTVTIKGPPRMTAPAQATIYAHYDGNWLDHSVISVAANGGTVSSLTGTTLTTAPFVNEYTTAVNPHGITAGPDGNVWFTERGSNAIGKITPTGLVTSYPCAPCNQPTYIVFGPDGNFWFTENAGGYVDKMTLAGAATRVASLPGNGMMIVDGPDGNLWMGNDGSNNISEVTTAGVLTNHAIGFTAWGVGFGPDQNLLYLCKYGTTLGKMNVAGVTIATYAIASDGAGSDGVVIGPDGNTWFVNDGAGLIEKITAAGAITPYTLQGGASPRDITVGKDGYLWFSESGTNSIGRISTSGALTEYGAAYGINGGATPIGITLGPDGNIWFAEFGTNKVGKFVL